MENLKSVLAQIIEQAKPYAITAGIAFVAGLLAHWIF